MAAVRPSLLSKNKDEKGGALRSYPAVIPSQVNPKDLHYGRLLTAQQYNDIKKYAQDQKLKSGRYSKKYFAQFGVRYSIIWDEDTQSAFPIYNFESYVLTEQQRVLIKERLKGLNPGYYPKATFDNLQPPIPCNVVKHTEENVDSDIQAVLGMGAVGSIKLVENPPSCRYQWSALKTATITQKNPRQLMQAELESLNALGFSMQKQLIERASKKSATKVEFIMAYVPGVRIQDVAKEFYRCGPRATTRMALALFAEYMAKIFNQGYLHRDISYNNFHYDRKWNRAGIVDLGSAQRYEKDKTARHSNRIVTPGFCAPELVAAKEISADGAALYVASEKTEVFAWGVLLIEILLRHRRCRSGIDYRYIELDPAYPSEFKNDAAVWKFLNSMVNYNPEKRPTLGEVHDFLRNLNNKHDVKTKKLRDDLAFIALKAKEEYVVSAISKLIDMLSGFAVDFDENDFDVYCKNVDVVNILKQHHDTLFDVCEGFSDEIKKRWLKEALVKLYPWLLHTESLTFKAARKLEQYLDNKPVDLTDDDIAIYYNEKLLDDVIKQNAPTCLINRILAYQNKIELLLLQLKELYDALLPLEPSDPIVIALKKLHDKLNRKDVVFTDEDFRVYRDDGVVADILRKNPGILHQIFFEELAQAKEALDELFCEYKPAPTLYRVSLFGLQQPVIKLLQKLKDHLDKNAVTLDAEDFQVCVQNDKIKKFVSKYKVLLPVSLGFERKNNLDQKLSF